MDGIPDASEGHHAVLRDQVKGQIKVIVMDSRQVTTKIVPTQLNGHRDC